jgi:hypothetical protein
MLTRALSLLLVVLTAACGDDGSPPVLDGGGVRDGGAVRDSGIPDGGPMIDSGCRASAACTPTEVCQEGRMVCDPTPACEATGPAAADTMCTGGTCDGMGVCVRTQTGEIVASDADLGDAFGSAVAIDGARAIVGAGSPGTGSFADAAYIYERMGAGWREAAILTTTDITGGQFGVAVDIDGDLAVVGSPNASHTGMMRAGAAYVFERAASGAWMPAGRLIASDPTELERFGRSVAISGNRIAVGAFANAMLPGDLGYVYVFERGSGGAFTEVAKLRASDGREGDGLGMSVDIDGDTVVAGAPFDNNTTGERSGAVYVFTRAGGGGWSETGRLLATEGTADDELGTDLSLAGDRLAVGAPVADVDGDAGAGAVYLFERPSGGAFAQVARLVASDGAPNDYFAPCALDGDLLVVGAPGYDRVGRRDTGIVYVFARGASGFAERERRYITMPVVDDRFGVDVALSGMVALVGTPGRDRMGASEGGGVFFFDPI